MKLAQLALGASFLAGIMTAPAMAASITNATTGGANDVLVYGANSTNTFQIANTPGNLTTALTGDASSPTGNVELFASSESSGSNFNTPTTLSGTLNGKSIVLSSVTAADWNVFGLQWFGEFLDVALNPQGQFARSMVGDATLYGLFGSNGQRTFSDPNISYVNQDDATGEVKVGLAGHFNAYTRVVQQIPSLAAYLKPNFQASEIVKIEYDGGPAEYFWSFSATASGLTEAGDGVSHSGNYEISFMGDPVEDVPEPASVLGLVALGGLAVAAKRKAVA